MKADGGLHRAEGHDHDGDEGEEFCVDKVWSEADTYKRTEGSCVAKLSYFI